MKISITTNKCKRSVNLQFSMVVNTLKHLSPLSVFEVNIKKHSKVSSQASLFYHTLYCMVEYALRYLLQLIYRSLLYRSLYRMFPKVKKIVTVVSV